MIICLAGVKRLACYKSSRHSLVARFLITFSFSSRSCCACTCLLLCLANLYWSSWFSIVIYESRSVKSDDSDEFFFDLWKAILANFYIFNDAFILQDLVDLLWAGRMQFYK